MRIVIADDSVLLREGLAVLLADAGHDVVASVGDGEACVEAVQRLEPDLTILDVRMPPTRTDEGLRAAVEILRRQPAMPIMMLSQFIERSYADQLIDSARGGVGYLLKDRVSAIDEFLSAVEQVREGQTVLDPQVIRQLMSRGGPEQALDALTPREREVLSLIAEGLTNQSIANRLVVTEGAVEKHVQRIFGKLALTGDTGEHRRVTAVLAYLRA